MAAAALRFYLFMTPVSQLQTCYARRKEVSMEQILNSYTGESPITKQFVPSDTLL